MLKIYLHGAVGSGISEYFEMEFKGKYESTKFEVTTVDIFIEVFGNKEERVQPNELTPDIFIISDQSNYIIIIDNKA